MEVEHLAPTADRTLSMAVGRGGGIVLFRSLLGDRRRPILRRGATALVLFGFSATLSTASYWTRGDEAGHFEKAQGGVRTAKPLLSTSDNLISTLEPPPVGILPRRWIILCSRCAGIQLCVKIRPTIGNALVRRGEAAKGNEERKLIGNAIPALLRSAEA